MEGGNNETFDTCEDKANESSVSDSPYDYGSLRPLDSVAYIIIGHLLVGSGAFGMLGNGLVIALIRLNKGLRGPFHHLLEANSWANFGIACLGNPLAAAAALSNRWHFGQRGCDYYGFVMTFCGISSINFITTISVERYLCIVHPQFKITGKLVAAGLGASMMAALAWAVFPLIGWSYYHTDGIGIGCCPTLNADPLGGSYSLAIVIFEAIIPLIIMIYCHTKIVLAVRRSAIIVARHFGSARDRDKQREWRVTKVVVLANVAFMVAWGPYTVTSTYFALYPDHISTMANTVSVVIAKCSTIWNPAIYMGSHRQYQKAFIKLVHAGGRSMLPATDKPDNNPATDPNKSSEDEMNLLSDSTKRPSCLATADNRAASGEEINLTEVRNKANVTVGNEGNLVPGQSSSMHDYNDMSSIANAQKDLDTCTSVCILHESGGRPTTNLIEISKVLDETNFTDLTEANADSVDTKGEQTFCERESLEPDYGGVYMGKDGIDMKHRRSVPCLKPRPPYATQM